MNTINVDLRNLNLTQVEGIEGRIVTAVLPFFRDRLSFDEQDTHETILDAYMATGSWPEAGERVLGYIRGYEGVTITGDETLRRAS